MTQDKMKQAAARAAMEYITPGDIIGVGTGSTTHFFIDELGAAKARIGGAIASSEATAQRLREKGIAVFDLNTIESLALYVDGADEITPQGVMIKGGGGALTREKIIASVAHQFICIADASKLVSVPGAFPLPVEVIPMAQAVVARRLHALGGMPHLRLQHGKPMVTDNGCSIIDVYGLQIDDPAALEEHINAMPGVVTVGLFAQRKADVALIGTREGVQKMTF